MLCAAVYNVKHAVNKTTQHKGVTQMLLQQLDTKPAQTGREKFAAFCNAAERNQQMEARYTPATRNAITAAVRNLRGYIETETPLIVAAHYVNYRKKFIAVKFEFTMGTSSTRLAMLLTRVGHADYFGKFASVTAVQTSTRIVIIRVYP